MLFLVKKYGLSHVCANSEFKNIEDFALDGDDDVTSLDAQVSRFVSNFNFPYLDIYFKKQANIEWSNAFKIEFYFRGRKHQEIELQNLFEYLLWTSLHGEVFLNWIDLFIYRV